MNNDFSLLVLFTLGLFSSFHCIGMCGGVIGALTFGLDQKIRENKYQLVIYLFAYNFGRLFSYMIAGIIVGFIGKTLIDFIGMNSAHLIAKSLSAAMMISVGLYIAGWFPQFSKLDSLGSKIWKRIQPLGQRFMPVKTPQQALGFGMVWGWLPCGLVYSALLLAALGSSPIKGGLGMLAFGTGTLPAVIGTGLITGGLSHVLRKTIVRKLFGVIMIVLALLTFFSPMNHNHSQHMDHSQHSNHSQINDDNEHHQMHLHQEP